MTNIAAFILCTVCSFNIAVGDHAGSLLTTGTCNILVGHGINTPRPDTSYYINVDGIRFPNSIRTERWFQTLVRERAKILILTMTREELGGGYPAFRGNLSDALEQIERMPFFEKECAPKQS